MINAPLILVEPFAAQMAVSVSLLPYPPFLGISLYLPASFLHDGTLITRIDQDWVRHQEGASDFGKTGSVFFLCGRPDRFMAPFPARVCTDTHTAYVPVHAARLENAEDEIGLVTYPT